MASLDGRVALVTGGGTGIGAAIAGAFAGAGARVAVTGRRPAPLAQTVQRIAGGERDSEAERRWADRGEWFKEPAEAARLALFVAALPSRGPTGQVFSLAGRLL
jgi:short chain dehydrogenase